MLAQEIEDLKIQIKHVKTGISQKKRNIVLVDDINPNLIDQNEAIMSTTQLNNKIQRVWQGTLAIEKVNYRIISENINLVQSASALKEEIKLIQEEIAQHKVEKDQINRRLQQEGDLWRKVKAITQKFHLGIHDIIQYNNKIRKSIRQKEKAKIKLQEIANKIMD